MYIFWISEQHTQSNFKIHFEYSFYGVNYCTHNKMSTQQHSAVKTGCALSIISVFLYFNILYYLEREIMYMNNIFYFQNLVLFLKFHTYSLPENWVVFFFKDREIWLLKSDECFFYVCMIRCGLAGETGPHCIIPSTVKNPRTGIVSIIHSGSFLGCAVISMLSESIW